MQIMWNASGCVWQCVSRLENVFHLHRNALVHLLGNNTYFDSDAHSIASFFFADRES